MASPSRSWAGNVWTPNLGLSPQTAVARRFSGGKDVGASTGQHSPRFASVIDPLGEGYWERV